MTKKLSVSVVIPAYNEASSIAKCLESLKSQTVLPDEIIVVDNNCTDRTCDIARRYGARIVQEPRQGIAHARSAGFDAVKNDIIVRIDADCIAMPDFVERLVDRFQRTPSVSGIAAEMSIKEWHAQIPWLARQVPVLVHNAYFKNVFGGHVMIGSAMALRRIFWELIREEVMSMHEWLNEDVQLSIIANRHGVVAQEKKALVVCETKDLLRPRKFLRYLGEDARTISHQRKRKRTARSRQHRDSS